MRLLEHDTKPAVERITVGARRVAAVVALAMTLGGAIVAAWAGTWRSSSAGWRELAEQRAQQVEELNKRVGVLETQVRSVTAENENLRRINLEYQQVILEMRGEVGQMKSLLRREGIH